MDKKKHTIKSGEKNESLLSWTCDLAAVMLGFTAFQGHQSMDTRPWYRVAELTSIMIDIESV